MKVRRNNASNETIEVLIANSKKMIADFEYLLNNTELIKSKLCNNGLSINSFHLIFELLSGSLLGLYEVCIDLKCMLGASNVYVKRYHIQMINMSQYEWCVYLGGRDQNGILPNLINHHNDQHNNSLELENILKQVVLFGRKCSVDLRNMTAHYDKPDVMYKKLVAINDEDVYAKRLGDQLLICDMIFKYLSLLIKTIPPVLFGGDVANVKSRVADNLDIPQIINHKIADAFSKKEKLGVAIEEQIADAWNNIEIQKRMFDRSEKAIAYLKSKQLDCVRLIEP